MIIVAVSSEGTRKVPIIFRNMVSEIPTTTYATFAIYRYPAKFIPQVVAYVLKTYCKPGMTVFDPFAGYGTVGVVSRVYGYSYVLWELNPIINVTHNTAIMTRAEADVEKIMKDLMNSREEFLPKWSNLHYWFPEDFLPLLSKAWGFVHSLTDEKKYLLLIPLLKVTRYFSYSDEKVHKLFKSKYSKQKVETLLKTNWKVKFYDMLKNEILTLIKKIEEYNQLKPKAVDYELKAGIDTLETRLDKEVNVLITSPPYLQAQEYIRSTKLELFWLGYDEKYIQSLSKREIPYRQVKSTNIFSETYYTLREKITESHLRALYDNYFNAILQAFATLGERVADYMFIFVGPAKIRNLPIPIDDIVTEHLRELGWRHEVTYVDKIVSRVMFEADVNPATGLEDSRIKTEHLVVLKKVR
ncbi:MAG: cytosine methylase [Metallosphaera sp.]|uniref:cytosine methylase n=1 Tax=Metallosphaera sp. TaxID=2020860 RepID=UPI003160CB4C